MPLHKAGRDVLGVRLPAQYACPASNARCWTVTALWRIAGAAEYLDQHCIINIATKGTFNGIRIDSVAVCSELDFIRYAAGFFITLAAEIWIAISGKVINPLAEKSIDLLLGVLVGMVLGTKEYYFGSSAGSDKKSDLLADIAKQP